MCTVPVVEPLALTHLASQKCLFVEGREKALLFPLAPEEKRWHLSFVWLNLFIIVFCIRRRNFFFREYSPVNNVMGVLVDGSWTWASNVCLQPWKPTVPWAASTEVWPAGWGRQSCFSALCWWGLTWSSVSRCGVHSTGETWACWSVSREGPQKWPRGWN